MFSLSRILFMIYKELIQNFRDKRTKAIIFFIPVIQLIIFGFAVSNDVKNISTAVYDLDKSYESREIIRKFISSGYFEILYYPDSEKTLTDLIEWGKVTCIIQINNGFAKDIKKGRDSDIQIIFDGTDSNTATIAIGYATQIISQFNKDIGKTMAKIKISQVETRIRAWYNPELLSRNFFVPGVAAVLIMLTCLLLTSMAIVREREIGTIEQLMVTPLKSVELIMGKTFPFALIGFIDMFIVIFFALMIFDIPFRGSILLLCLGTAVYLMSVLGFGLFISTIAKTQQQAMMAVFLFFAPAMLLSGFVFPIDNMPVIFQYFTYINPLRYFLIIIRGIFLKGNGFDLIKDELLALLVLGIVISIFSSLRFKKRLG